MSKEVPRGSRKLKPITPLLERGGFHAPLLPICLDQMGARHFCSKHTQFLSQKQGVDAFSETYATSLMKNVVYYQVEQFFHISLCE